MTSSVALPPYLRVAAAVRERIRRGEIAPGERIPSYRELADAYDVAVMTAQKAVRALQDEGWAAVTPSVGVFAQVPDGTAHEQRDELYPQIIQQLHDLEAAVRTIAARLDHLEESVQGLAELSEPQAPQPEQ